MGIYCTSMLNLTSQNNFNLTVSKKLTFIVWVYILGIVPNRGRGGVDGRKMEFRTISKIFQLGGGKKFEIFGILLSMSDGRKIAKFQEYTLMLHC